MDSYWIETVKLLDRILANWCDYIGYKELRHEIQNKTKEAFAVDIQNIREWFDENPDDSVDLKRICPLFKLPLPVLWMEFRSEHYENGALLYLDESDKQAIIIDLFLRPVNEKRAFFLARMMGIPNDEYQLTSIRRMCPPFVKTEEEAEKWENIEKEDEQGNNIIFYTICIAVASIAFFHCKNVSLKKTSRPQALAKKFKKLRGASMPSFHTIEVHRSVAHTIISEHSEHTKRAAHAAFIRGHFKKYDGDSKLFGKKNGMWFWEMHIRGEGKVMKSDYRIWPPEGKHKTKCIIQEKLPM